jgi:hypothetical protein
MQRAFIVLTMLFLYACNQNRLTRARSEKFEAKYVKVLPDTTRMMLIGNVVIKYGQLYAEADSALLEKPKQLVSVFGASKIMYQGNEITPDASNDTMVYDKDLGTLITN